MNQKDYKEIAGIINKPYELIEIKPYIRNTCNQIAERLADLFEREEIKGYADKWTFKQAVRLKKTKFNKQQFLKDCGIMEVE